MVRQAEPSTVELYCNMARVDLPTDETELRTLPMRVILPAFVTSELKAAFMIGFLLYIPFKLLLFILLDGWQLLFSTLIQGIH